MYLKPGMGQVYKKKVTAINPLPSHFSKEQTVKFPFSLVIFLIVHEIDPLISKVYRFRSSESLFRIKSSSIQGLIIEKSIVGEFTVRTVYGLELTVRRWLTIKSFTVLELTVYVYALDSFDRKLVFNQ